MRTLGQAVCVLLFSVSASAFAADDANYLRLTQEGWLWVATSDKKALVCDIEHWTTCLQQLPPLSLEKLELNGVKRSLGRQDAMVLPLKHPHIAGIVLLAPGVALSLVQPLVQSARATLGNRQLSINVNGTLYPLMLEQQALLTLWHELGHLENIGLQGNVLPADLSAYQHEWLADLYVLWRSVNSSQGLTLAWQQYHRRNMALINDSANLSHWSAPQLQSVLQGSSVASITHFSSYHAFLREHYPSLTQLTDSELREYSSLVQRTFGPGAVQALPSYMFWRQVQLAKWLSPTLGALMGPKEAQTWLVEQFSALQ